MELLKQHQYPRRYPLELPRSRVIQDLSTFNHYLEAMSKGNSNYTVCERISRIIGRVLDQVLDAVQMGAAIVNGGVVGKGVGDEMGGDEGLRIEDGDEVRMDDEVMELEPDMQAVLGDFPGDMEFMDWLNGVDWSKGPWTESF